MSTHTSPRDLLHCVQWTEERQQRGLYAEHVCRRPGLYIEIPTLSNPMSDLQTQTAVSQSGRKSLHFENVRRVRYSTHVSALIRPGPKHQSRCGWSFWTCTKISFLGLVDFFLQIFPFRIAGVCDNYSQKPKTALRVAAFHLPSHGLDYWFILIIKTYKDSISCQTSCRNIKHQTDFSSPCLLPYLSKPLISLHYWTFSSLKAVRGPVKSFSAQAFHAFLCQCEGNGLRAWRCNTDSHS